MANTLKKVSSFTLFDPAVNIATTNDLLYYINKTPIGYDSYGITLTNFFTSTNKVQSVKFASNTVIISSGSTSLTGTLNVSGASTFGSIQNSPIGGTTPNTAIFTTVSASTITSSNVSVTNTLTSNNISLSGTLLESSDSRLKSDIEKIENALDKVNNLSGYTFVKNGQRSTGVIAQEIQQVLPEAVQEKDGYLSVAYGNLIGLLIEAIKEQQKEIEELKNK